MEGHFILQSFSAHLGNFYATWRASLLLCGVLKRPWQWRRQCRQKQRDPVDIHITLHLPLHLLKKTI